MKPRLLDLFCGAGGAAVGYHRAGFEVVGVDIAPQPNYPFPFLQTDALGYLRSALALEEGHGLPIAARYSAIHASPPCQRYSQATRVSGKPEEHPDLVGPTRELLRATGLPYVIENVPEAELADPVLICGSMFDPPLDVRRHRHFEANWPLQHPQWPCRHKLWDYRFPSFDKRKRRASRVVAVYGGGQLALSRVVGVHGHVNYGGEGELRKRAMEIDWMTQNELSEAIPPRYTELIGHQLMQHVQKVAA